MSTRRQIYRYRPCHVNMTTLYLVKIQYLRQMKKPDVVYNAHTMRNMIECYAVNILINWKWEYPPRVKIKKGPLFRK